MTRMQSSASGCFDLLYKHFNYIKNMGRQWPSMPRHYISSMIRILIKSTIFQKTKGSDYLTMLTLGQLTFIFFREVGIPPTGIWFIDEIRWDEETWRLHWVQPYVLHVTCLCRLRRSVTFRDRRGISGCLAYWFPSLLLGSRAAEGSSDY